MLNRRTFLTMSAASGSLAVIRPIQVLGSRQRTSAEFYGVHQFIENNPDAVFIMRTSVDDLNNFDAIREAGLTFSRAVFVPKSEADGGVPITNKVAVKPNLTSRGQWHASLLGYKYGEIPYEMTLGIVTHPYFTEGVIAGIQELGVSGSQIYINEKNGLKEEGDYPAMAERAGLPAGNVGTSGSILLDTPEGSQWFEQIKYLYPFNADDTFYLNLAKFKTHEMGITLSAKNIQGTCNTGYVNHCNPWNDTVSMPGRYTMIEGAREMIYALWERHVSEGYWGWETPPAESDYDDYTGLGMETWAQRNIDNNITSKVNLHIVEGIIGRDGNFNVGPHPVELNGETRYIANDILSNIIIFGKKSYHVDIIGAWLSGNEPGNFGLFRIALERGVISDINPAHIPVYEITADSQIIARSLTDFQRFELRSDYLNSLGEGADPGETEWKLINDPYDYGSVTAVNKTDEKPQAIVLSQNHPNPFNPNTSIEYRLPRGGNVRLEIFNRSGQLVDMLVDGYRDQGSHMATWNTGNFASGTYFYRLRFGGFTETRKMTVLK
ncbi:MAG: DUF362 domain-containing protein [Candidatus Latescibacteria bacterium]|nr:DUF362 domain-containing protein [Candidatus Latescibacterota bacterium]